MSLRRLRYQQGRRGLVAFLLLAALPPNSGHAQSAGGAVGASSEILLPPVTGTGSQDLRFGQVRLGETVDVPPGPAGPGAPTSSAGWLFGNIRKGRWVSLDLTLPAELRRGGYAIPVNWNNPGYGLLCVAGSTGVCALTGSFNPGAWSSLYFQLSNTLPGNNFEVRLFVGGRIQVPESIPPGVYSAQVTAVFAYVT